mmetsp:Transcript_13172/g.30297  ORF Transcript_13172/g.30297 Transcript_13172/m.30297 type:complete len:96 (+) Transcript_13172:279-566(+)
MQQCNLSRQILRFKKKVTHRLHAAHDFHSLSVIDVGFQDDRTWLKKAAMSHLVMLTCIKSVQTVTVPTVMICMMRMMRMVLKMLVARPVGLGRSL